LIFDDVEFRISEQSGRTEVLSPTVPLSCSLVRLGMTVGYPWRASAGRPAGFVATFLRGDKTIQTARLVALSNGEEFSTIVSLVSPSDFPSILGEGTTAVQEWDRVVFSYPSGDWLDVPASAVRVNRIGCFRRQEGVSLLAAAERP
jgi:hypothetical protein